MQPGQQSIQLAKAKAADAERFAWEQRLLAGRSRWRLIGSAAELAEEG